MKKFNLLESGWFNVIGGVVGAVVTIGVRTDWFRLLGESTDGHAIGTFVLAVVFGAVGVGAAEVIERIVPEKKNIQLEDHLIEK